MRPHRSLLVGSLALAGLLFGVWRCQSNKPLLSGPESLQTPAGSDRAAIAPAEPRAADDPSPAPNLARPPGAASDTALAAVQEPAAVAPSGETFGTSDNAVNALLQRIDAHDLALYGNIERQLHRDVPREVRDLVALKKSGATRQQLVVEINKATTDLRLRLLLSRWLDDSFGITGAPKAPVPGSVKGSGPSLTHPLKAAK
jgi:hypothetical protein